jgi:hypothetical protein
MQAPGRIMAGPPIRDRVGTAIVAGLLLLAVGLAAFAVWFQWLQTRRCLGFYGAAVARRIQAAERVELWRLGWDESRHRPVVAERLDVSRAGGLVHLRRGLVEDANFTWEDASRSIRLPEGAWDEALAFFDPAADAAPTVLAFDLDTPAAITVVGSPGRVTLGRIAGGLKTWIAATRTAARP